MKTKLMALEALKLYAKAGYGNSTDLATQGIAYGVAIKAISALEADIAKPVEPHGWLIDGSLLYRLNDHGSNCDEINVSMADGLRIPEIRALAAASLLKRITTPQEPASAESDGWKRVPIVPTREMCAAAVKYANGDAVYKNVAAAALEIEESIYGEAYSAMLAAAPGGAA